MSEEIIKQIFYNLQRRLDEIDGLLHNFDNAPGQQRATISRIAVEGRSITNILQNLRGKVENFDAWYEPKVQEMRADELLRYFYQLRTETLKEGKDKVLGVQVKPMPKATIQSNKEGITIERVLDNGEHETIFHKRPENTINVFLGDQTGGAGFIIKDQNGKEKKQYVHIPREALNISVLFENPPTEHKKIKITDTNPRNLCILFCNYLKELCDQAKQQFNN